MGGQQSTQSILDEDLSHLKHWTMEEINEYNRMNEATVIVIHNKVFDVSKFKDEHPGGPAYLEDVKGRDAGQDFDDIGHSQDAIDMMREHLVGVLDSER